MKIQKVSEILGTQVYTDAGEYFGVIEQANLFDNRIDGWRIKVTARIQALIGGASGVIIPHQFVKSIGDICVISRTALPTPQQNVEETLSGGDLM